ncbi:MAG: rhamnan synthesis F family protein [Acetobacter sp.]|nr:rhamnan synthesis F family protein [Acetobacter sp.]
MLKNLPLEKIAATILLLGYLIHWAFYDYQPIEIDYQFAPYTKGENAAVFAAYSADGTIPDYVVDYLKKLKQIAPNIVYVTDNPIKRGEIKKIKPYISHLLAYRHGEYDWGSYKRGVAILKNEDTFNKLILANDSTLPLANTFHPILAKMTTENADIYGITANKDGAYHLQSYFLILTPEAWKSTAFAEYLNAVKPEKDGLTVAYHYEVPFTQYMEEQGFKSAAHIPYDSLSTLPLNDKNCYPLTMISQYNAPFLKMRTFTNRLNVQESRRLVFNWLKKNKPTAYHMLLTHLKNINSPYLKDAHE